MKRQFVPFAVMALFMALLLSGPTGAQGGGTVPSPILTPSIPLPPSTQPSPEATNALLYISRREGIPIEGLLIVNDYERAFPFIGRTFRAVTIFDVRSTSGREYNLLVDLKDGYIEEDVNGVEAAENAAYNAKYSKLHPALYERLQQVGDDDVLPIAIWVAPVAGGRTQEQVYAELAARYPEAAAAMERSGKPFDVADPAKAQEIWQAYWQMVTDDTAARVGPLVEYLSQIGFEPRTYGSMPSIVAALPKREIVRLAERLDVGAIYLVDAPCSVDTDTAIPTDRVPLVWNRGFNGSGERLAILEFGNIAPDTGCLDIIAVRPGVLAPGVPPEHKTLVASVAACSDNTHTGAAPGVDIVDAGFDGADWPGGISQADAVEALRWAVQDESSRVVNLSARWEADNNLNWTDRAFDYWARAGIAFISKSAGNRGQGDGQITSPGKAWNVVTVGGSDDADTPAWSDDNMYGSSSYVNPVGVHREKPEVVAPAVNLDIVGPGGALFPAWSGTSFSTPQVAGLAALLIDRNPELRVWPEALRAIIMASAIHNIDGPSDIPIGQEDLRDGAGSIDAALADEAAKLRGLAGSVCSAPCWWAFPTSINNPPVNGSVYRSFSATRGDRIRVAIAWWANADQPAGWPNPIRDELMTNYNLYVYDPSGDLVGYTASLDNNYELAEFVAEESGIYQIHVYRSDWGDMNEAGNNVGIAWVRDATHLPDLRNQDGRVSSIYIRNDGAEPRTVHIYYFDEDGSNGNFDTCGLDPNQRCWINVSDGPRIPSTGAAIVDSGENVSVVVKTQKPNAEAEGYTGLPSVSPFGFAPGTTLYLPSYLKNFPPPNGKWQSYIVVENTGEAGTDVFAHYYNTAGNEVAAPYYYLPAGAIAQVEPPAGVPDNGSVELTASEPLAAVVTQYRTESPMKRSDFVSFSQGASTVYLPQVLRNYSNWVSSFRVRNLGTSQTHVRIDYYDTNGFVWSESANIPSRGVQEFWQGDDYLRPGQTGFNRSAVIVSEDGQPLAVICNQENNNPLGKQHQSYNGFIAGSSALHLPAVERGSEWNTDILVQAVGGSAATIYVTFFDLDGRRLDPIRGPFTVDANETMSLYQFISPMDGSAEVVAVNGRIGVLVNQKRLNWADGSLSYTGDD
ncbi:MAG: S8 family serine peptidase [Anaerolineae bacterium]|nr:S8 family serine peptidase [Anaerolineae bacterium]